MSLTFVTSELDVLAFQHGIFVSESDLLAPVAVRPQFPFMCLKQVFAEQKRQPSLWATYAGPGGVGQYSLKRGKPAGVLARFDVYFREPSQEEMGEDFRNFGEQVVGPAVDEVAENERGNYKTNSRFRPFSSAEHFFVGPPRVDKSLFLSRVFNGGIPQDVSRLINEVDAQAEKGEGIVHQGYQFFHAEAGRVVYLPFNTQQGYDPSKLQLFGNVKLSGPNTMAFHPRGGRDSIDYSAILVRI